MPVADEHVQADDRDQARGPRQDDAPRLLHARVAPHLPVEPEQVVAREVDDHDQREQEEEVAPVHPTARIRGNGGRAGSGRRAPRPDASSSASGTSRRTRATIRPGSPGGPAGEISGPRSVTRHLSSRGASVGKEAAELTVPRAYLAYGRGRRPGAWLDGARRTRVRTSGSTWSIGTSNASAISAEISSIVDVPSHIPNTIVAVGFRRCRSVDSSS